MEQDDKENILYIIGGGLTQATAARCGKAANIYGLSAISQDVLQKAGDYFNKESSIGEIERNVINHLLEQCASYAPNLEELIEHLSLSGTSAHDKLAVLLGAQFFHLLRERMRDLKDGATENLAQILIDYHRYTTNKVRCVGILTTNYDRLIEEALESCGYTPDLGFSGAYDSAGTGHTFPLLKLHGSIDWTDAVPVRVADPPGAEHASWIGPRRTKRAQDYPFNLIWGKARELLARTDRIRVVGASLYASDWHVLHLLFQWAIPRDAEESTNRTIEIINSPKRGDELVEAYPELPIVPLYRVPEVRDFVLSQEPERRPDPDYEDENDKLVRKRLKDKKNVAEVWLQALVESDIEVTTESEPLDHFITNVAGGA